MTTTKPTSADIETEWTRLANLVPLVRYCLEPRASVEAGRGKPESRPPFNVNASKLLAEINEEVGFYVHVLMDETHDFRVPPTLEGRVLAVRDRHGHFLGDDDQSGLDMLSCAETLNSRALGLAAPIPIPRWSGPCEVIDCEGDLRQRDGAGFVKCDKCGSVVTLADWRERMRRALEGRIVYRSEIRYALRVMGMQATHVAVDNWVKRGQIVAVIRDPEMFRLADVIEYAEGRRENRGPKLMRVAP